MIMEKLWLSRENRAVFCLKTGINTSPLHTSKSRKIRWASSRGISCDSPPKFLDPPPLYAHLSRPSLERAVSDEAATAPTPQFGPPWSRLPSHLLSFCAEFRPAAGCLTNYGVMSNTVCSESVREQKYICQSSCDQKESRLLSFFAFFIVKRAC